MTKAYAYTQNGKLSRSYFKTQEGGHTNQSKKKQGKRKRKKLEKERAHNAYCREIHGRVFCEFTQDCRDVKEESMKRGKLRLADKKIKKKIIDGQEMGKWGDTWLPVCDGSGYPFVKGCFHDMSNWTAGPKQCIIENPATPNLASGSLYTCGFLW